MSAQPMEANNTHPGSVLVGVLEGTDLHSAIALEDDPQAGAELVAALGISYLQNLPPNQDLTSPQRKTSEFLRLVGTGSGAPFSKSETVRHVRAELSAYAGSLAVETEESAEPNPLSHALGKLAARLQAFQNQPSKKELSPTTSPWVAKGQRPEPTFSPEREKIGQAVQERLEAYGISKVAALVIRLRLVERWNYAAIAAAHGDNLDNLKNIFRRNSLKIRQQGVDMADLSPGTIPRRNGAFPVEREVLAMQKAFKAYRELEEGAPGARGSTTAKRNQSDDSDAQANANARDSIGAYLRQIGKTKLLTAEEEVALAQEIELGLAAEYKLWQLEDQMADFGLLRDLRSIKKSGERANNALIEANLRLVVSIARRYVKPNMKLEDLIQEGNEGLMHAVEKFDYAQGIKFSTYATWWIRQRMSRARGRQTRSIQVPVHVAESIQKLNRIRDELLQEGGQEPTVEQLAVEMNITHENVAELLQFARGTVSLDTPVGEDGKMSLGDFVTEENYLARKSPENLRLRRDLEIIIAEIPDEMEAAVLRALYGLGPDGATKTYVELARDFGVLRQTIHYIEKKAIARLRTESAERLEAHLIPPKTQAAI